MSDNDPKDPLMRNLITLGLIPRHRGRTTQELLAALKSRGFNITLRTLQRDLNEKLSRHFPIVPVEEGNVVRWRFHRDARFNLPALDPAEALAMHLAEDHLKQILPPAVLVSLEPQFADARRQLESLDHNALTNWARRVRVLPNGKALLPASVEKDAWEQVATALLEQRQLQVDYLSRAKNEVKTMQLHPKGLVSRGPVTYLLASVGDYTDVRHFAMHRIQSASALDAKARDDDFDMDAYLPTAAFTPRQGTGMVELVADVHPQLAQTLRETPLGKDQGLEPLAGSDWQRLSAQVPDDQETLSWLFGLAENILVHAPISLRSRIEEKIRKTAGMYADPAGLPRSPLHCMPDQTHPAPRPLPTARIEP